MDTLPSTTYQLVSEAVPQEVSDPVTVWNSPMVPCFISSFPSASAT